MSTTEQQGHSSNAAGGILAQRKKRHHSNAAAAIAARRAGHLGSGITAEEDEGQEAPFISSSRDASEEDNDDASGFSDSASSLRFSHSNHPSSIGLPTSARDRALVDSKGAHRRPSNSAADKTPSSSSPPRHHGAIQGYIGGQDYSSQSARRPSHTGIKDPSISATLAKASQALSTSSSTDMDHLTGRSATGLLRKGSASSAGSDVGDGPAHDYINIKSGGNNKLDLTNLPAPMPIALGSQTIVVTPKAPDTQRDHPQPPKRKTSNPSHPSVHIVASKKASQETDGEEATDGAAASPYDGDVEFAARTPSSTTQQSGVASGSHTSTNTASLGITTFPIDVPSNSYVSAVRGSSSLGGDKVEEEPVSMASTATIRNFIHKAIYEPDPNRLYRINHPVDDGKNPSRPIRIYADGVYDLFHYAHALQLRQAKLFFPSVYLIVGVVSSESCAKHKNAPVLTSSERYTSVRNCKWVDEVIEDCPWVITQELLDKYHIDYVAHDEEPYIGSDGDAEIYKFCKDQGRFLPTQRTKGVSTSELLARIVDQYRHHNYDKKLAKIGHEELAFH